MAQPKGDHQLMKSARKRGDRIGTIVLNDQTELEIQREMSVDAYFTGVRNPGPIVFTSFHEHAVLSVLARLLNPQKRREPDLKPGSIGGNDVILHWLLIKDSWHVVLFSCTIGVDPRKRFSVMSNGGTQRRSHLDFECLVRHLEDLSRDAHMPPMLPARNDCEPARA